MFLRNIAGFAVCAAGAVAVAAGVHFFHRGGDKKRSRKKIVESTPVDGGGVIFMTLSLSILVVGYMLGVIKCGEAYNLRHKSENNQLTGFKNPA